MPEIKGVHVSIQLLEKNFVCDLNACKGGCCVKGECGAPLEENELPVLEQNYDAIKPYLSEEGQRAIDTQGKYLLYEQNDWVTDKQGKTLLGVQKGWTTPLVNSRECAYTIFENGIAKCGIEKAYFDGKTNFQKPVSCHLYPVRVNKIKNTLEAVKYDKWSICKPACKLGEQLKVPVYKFVKNGLIRKYGEDWYKELESTAESATK